jgi:hypothetical protein
MYKYKILRKEACVFTLLVNRSRLTSSFDSSITLPVLKKLTWLLRVKSLFWGEISTSHFDFTLCDESVHNLYLMAEVG